MMNSQRARVFFLPMASSCVNPLLITRNSLLTSQRSVTKQDWRAPSAQGATRRRGQHRMAQPCSKPVHGPSPSNSAPGFCANAPAPAPPAQSQPVHPGSRRAQGTCFPGLGKLQASLSARQTPLMTTAQISHSFLARVWENCSRHPECWGTS